MPQERNCCGAWDEPQGLPGYLSNTITLTYDTPNRLSTKAAPSEAAVSYGYDLAGHVIGVNDTSAAMTMPIASASYTQSAGYDALNSLLAKSKRKPTHAFSGPF